jgi:hypothetical protein
MAGKHIHVHLHRTADAGTSEGARKAAQTRGHGGGFQPRTPGGFGGASAARSHPEGFVQGVGPVHNKPKPDPEPFRGYDKSVKDAGTSEGAKKAAQTRAQPIRILPRHMLPRIPITRMQPVSRSVTRDIHKLRHFINTRDMHKRTKTQCFLVEPMKHQRKLGQLPRRWVTNPSE